MITVIKLGGRVQSDPALIVALSKRWHRAPGALCIVHGGGDEITALQRQLGREPSFVKGDQVTHPAFGTGVVVDSHVVGDDEQVTVLFRGHPTPKKLSLSFAPLTRV